jgi:hypothetical protein
MVRFKTARLKIERADKHIADVDQKIAALCSPESQSITLDIDSQTRNQRLHYDFKAAIPIDDFALVIGDAIHNLKTATDHGWFTLLSAFAPGAINDWSRFPIDVEKEKLEKRLQGVKIDTLSLPLFNFLVNDLKPYREGGDPFICAIHDLDIRDKHKLLIPLARISAVVDVVLEDETGRTTKGITWGNISEVLPITIPLSPKLKIKDYGHLVFDVMFEQGAAGKNQLSVSDTLHTFSKVSLNTIELMEDFFARSR